MSEFSKHDFVLSFCVQFCWIIFLILGWQLGANLTICSVQCSSQCFLGTCIPGSGHCYEGCRPGYQPPLCKTVCSPNYYGRNCSQRCSTKCHLSRCDFSTGFCISRNNITDLRSIEESSSDDAAAITVTLLILLLLTGSVSLVLYRKKCQSRQQEELLPVTPGTEDTENEASYYEMQPTYTSNLGEFTIINITDIRPSRTKAHSDAVNTPMTMQQLESYVTSYNRDNLISQFKSIQNSATATTYVGQSGPNKSRNRYTNICAYDHSRVPLQVTADTTQSDYINASYIKGCGDKIEYISAQGPLATTVNDFIRMLWEQKVEVVVMLTKLVEHARFRCEKYWSDSGETMFGAFQVSLVSAQSYTDYTIRTFKLQKNIERRHVVQFQFTSWPDKGIPDSPWALVDFQRRVSALKTTSLPVVHCSAGVGRTGTYIALQNIVNQAMTTGHMDFFNTVVRLREDRTHMVQTAEQYVFLHQAAYVAILSQTGSSIFNANNGNMSSAMPVSSAEQNLFIEQEYKILGQICELLMSQTQEDDKNSEENKRDSKVEKGLKDKPMYSRILKYAPYIRSDSTDTNNYVDATLLSGLRRQDQHILSELPKPTAVKDFWRLVVQYKVALVIAFEVDDVVTDSTIGCYQPLNTDYPFYCANYKIRSEFVCYSKFWDEHKMEVHVNYTKTGKPPLLHTLSHVKARKVWPLPESIAALLRQARSHRLQENERILYMCRNGSNYSNLTYCVNMLLDRLEEGVALAMPLVVGAVKSIIPGAVRSLEDYKSLYQAIQIYLETTTNIVTGQNVAGE
ncbi:receptor-type tyrosine-protein phosphatase delta-like isoform X3 [Biomphalaria glabrata]|uniref:protein-tyrosine-phosphatase n=1 Tax=Biomphalaria glabrata TaxID=6526 RepID=A0A9W3ACE8_BIOGL|nr:receptor-type tyrosine-protein phosphatase delta-like isoform X3 [Biomphalaria glabrata]